ncbi:hypothetical protein B9Z55_024407 [Caenorhabditis nigoni]|nr:hypothetical protein B9Z55_024407 [Caenorhabditis nigoni]
MSEAFCEEKEKNGIEQHAKSQGSFGGRENGKTSFDQLILPGKRSSYLFSNTSTETSNNSPDDCAVVGDAIISII